MTVAIGTIISANYIAFARVLATSLREFHPEIPFYMLLADDPAGLPIEADPYRILRLQQVDIPNLRDVLGRYDRQQVAISAKPFLLRHLLDRGHDRAVFVDADTLVTGDLSSLLRCRASITLLPHHLDPLEETGRELQVLVSGTFNGGVLGVNRTPTAQYFLHWWGERLWQDCRHDREAGLHFDQRCLDLVPSLFGDVDILRDPRINVAYWNLRERRHVVPALFHFSGFDPDRPDQVTWHAPKLRVADLGETANLYRWYAGRLNETGWHETRTWQYRLGRE